MYSVPAPDVTTCSYLTSDGCETCASEPSCDAFTVNQLWGYVEKGVDTGGCGWDWGFRADYVFGADGQDTQAFGSSDPQAWDDGARGPAQGVTWGVTWGVNWQPTASLKVRPELRYDWYDGPSVLPFDNGNASDQFSGGFDLIVTF